MKVLDILKKRNIKPIAPSKGVDIGELRRQTHIIIVDKYIFNKIKEKPSTMKILVIEKESDIERIVEEAICLFYGKQSYNEILLGLDPGPDYVAYALLVDGSLFESGRKSLGEIIKFIERIIKTIPYKKLYVKIGANLDGIQLAEAILSAISDFDNIFIEIVDEHSTTKQTLTLSEISSQHIRDKDIRAAINISLRIGSRINNKESKTMI